MKRTRKPKLTPPEGNASEQAHERRVARAKRRAQAWWDAVLADERKRAAERPRISAEGGEFVSVEEMNAARAAPTAEPTSPPR